MINPELSSQNHLGQYSWSNEAMRQYAKIEGLNFYELLHSKTDVSQPQFEKALIEINQTRELLALSGNELSPLGPILFWIDSKICGETQVPALTYIVGGGQFSDAKRMANERLLVTATVLADISGKAMTNFGLSEVSPTKILAAAGLGLSVGSQMVKMHTINSAGSKWSLLFRDRLKILEPHISMFGELLKRSGFTKEEIDGISKIGTDVYVSELQQSNLSRFENVFLPVFCAGAMTAYGDYGLAALTFVLGLSSFPIGEKAYIEADKKRAAQFRLGQSAKAINFLRRTYTKHIGMTDRLNFVAKFDQVLTAGLFLIASKVNTGNLLANVQGLRYGLSGLSGTLSHQRNREFSKRTTDFATRFLEIVGSRNFLLTQAQWLKHICEGVEVDVPQPQFSKGLVIKDFKIQLPDGNETSMPPVNIAVASGEILIWQAESGLGKSSLLAGLSHVLNHSKESQLYLVKDSLSINAHELSGPDAIGEEVVIIGPETIPATAQLVDIFREEFNLVFSTTIEATDKIIFQEWETAVNAEDSLVKAEIEKFVGGEKTAFDVEVMRELVKYRKQRLDWTNQLLKSCGGNLTRNNINGERSFSSLSSGEKQRVMVALAQSKQRIRNRTAIILDECVSHLDSSKNLPIQLEQIDQIRQSENAPAIILISHQYLEAIKKKFRGSCQTLITNGD